jgi:hypothetical protein
MKNIEKFINIMQGSGFSDSIDDEDGSLVLKKNLYNDKKIIFKNKYNSLTFTNEDVSISIFNDDGYFEGMVCNGLDDIIFSINDDCKILNTISKKTKVNIKIINMFGNTELNLVQ